jgi:hypothetical protein
MKRMIKEGERYCDRCGQKIPPKSKLFAAASNPGEPDYCLNCRIEISEQAKGHR